MAHTKSRPAPDRPESTARESRRPGCWPTIRQESLLRAALLDGEDAIAAWRQWSSSVDIENIDPGSFRLLPLAHRNLLALGVDDALMRRLRGVHRQSWFRNKLLFERTARILKTLHDAGIETLLLKGVPLARRYYREDGTRPMADADVLVRTHDGHNAARLLQSHGWRSRLPLASWPPPHRGSWAFVSDDEQEIELDLHWHVFGDCLTDTADEELWSASVSFALHDIQTRALCASDQLLHVLAHGIHWSPLPSIRWVADAAAILSGRGGIVDWRRLVDQAEQRRLAPIAAAGLRYLHHTIGSPVPDGVLTALAARSRSVPERIGLWARTHGGLLPGAIRMWSGYRRARADASGPSSPPGFVTYLCELWLVNSAWHLPGVVREKILRGYGYATDHGTAADTAS